MARLPSWADKGLFRSPVTAPYMEGPTTPYFEGGGAV